MDGHNNTLSHWQSALSPHWPLAGTLRRLHGEYDLNLSDGALVYKVMRPGLTEADVAAQIACQRHAAAAGIRVPAPVVTTGGALTRVIEDDQGEPRVVWALRRLAGMPLANLRPWPPSLAHAIGTELARLHGALADFEHPAVPRTHEWDIRALPSRTDLGRVLGAHPLAGTLNRIVEVHTMPACDALDSLPQQTIHNDLNEHNLLVSASHCAEASLTGIVDFGDMLRAPVIVDLAITAAYLVIGHGRPWPLLRALIAGYCTRSVLSEREGELLWPLLLSRLAQSVINAWLAREGGRDDPYLQISQRTVTRFLQIHADEHPAFVSSLVARASGGRDKGAELVDWLRSDQRQLAPVFTAPLADAPVLDLSVAGEHATDNPVQPDLEEIAHTVTRLAGDGAVLGRYGEARLIYGAPFFLAGAHGASDRRTVHLAIESPRVLRRAPGLTQAAWA
jgi:Ser/Thr protein kinase RdoA (MazF antagonist)